MNNLAWTYREAGKLTIEVTAHPTSKEGFIRIGAAIPNIRCPKMRKIRIGITHPLHYVNQPAVVNGL